MILSHRQIEEIAAAVTQDFNEFFFGKEAAGDGFSRATPIDQLAKDYLGLSISFASLSSDGSICGLTAYADTEYIVEEKGIRRTIPLKRNQVLLDEAFIKPGQVRQLCGKRRFTLAHECAHQILFQMESDAVRESCEKKYAARKAYSLRDLKTREDWNEWQANALGAALLMPQREMDLAIKHFAAGRTLINYGGKFSGQDRAALSMICGHFSVSKSAAIIRLRHLGHVEDRPYRAYSDSLEVRA